MTKKLMICPFCDDGRAFTWAGACLHVKAKHPNKLSEMKDNKDLYVTKFACDEVGNPIEAPEPTPEPEPTPTPAPEPTPEPKEPPAPEPKPKGKGDPAPEGGLFHRISTSIFG
jgi:hypothetical protein